MGRKDLYLDVSAMDYEQLVDSRRGESSASIHERVMHTRCIQKERFQDSPTHSNSVMLRQGLGTTAQLSAT